MKRSRTQLNYSPSRRRMRLDETRCGPLVKLILAVLGVAALALAGVFLLLPLLAGQPAPTRDEQTALEAPPPAETAEPLPQALRNAPEKILENGAPARVLADPSVCKNALLYATGESAESCARLMRLDLETGETEQLPIAAAFDQLRSPVEDDAYVAYVDARTGGGGAVCLYEKASGETTVVSSFAAGVPALLLENPYLVWTERTGERETTVYAWDMERARVLAVDCLSGGAAFSMPALKNGEVLLARSEGGGEGTFGWKAVSLTGESERTVQTDVPVDHLASNGTTVAFLSGTNLYVQDAAGEKAPVRIAENAASFALADSCAAFCGQGRVQAYLLKERETHALSIEGTNCQPVAAGADYVIWRDVTEPGAPVFYRRKVV